MRNDLTGWLAVLLMVSAATSGIELKAIVTNDPSGPLDVKLRNLALLSSPLVLAAVGCLVWGIYRFAPRLAEMQSTMIRDWQSQQPAREAAREHRRHAEVQRREESARRRAIASAVRALDCFYTRHRRILQSDCPPDLFIARREAEITQDMTGPQAWQAAKEVIASLQAAVVEHQNLEAEHARRARSRQTRKNDLERQIRHRRQQITQIQNSPLGSATNDQELFTLESQIGELDEELFQLNQESLTGDDQ